MEVEEIIRRRAKMDCKLDTQNFKLWGDEEIVGCVDEIAEKIKSTLKLFCKMSADRELKKEMEQAIEDIVFHKNVERFVSVWQEQYRLEKMFYILAKNDRRNKDPIKVDY